MFLYKWQNCVIKNNVSLVFFFSKNKAGSGTRAKLRACAWKKNFFLPISQPSPLVFLIYKAQHLCLVNCTLPPYLHIQKDDRCLKMRLSRNRIPPALLCVFSLSLHVFDALAKRILIPVGQAVWSSHDQSNKSNCLCPSPQPHMSCKKIWLQLLLRPKGNFQNSSPSHLSEMKLSSFLRFAEICLLILNHTVSSGFMTKTNVYHIYLCHWR